MIRSNVDNILIATNGTNGQPGAAGTSSYIHIKYSNDGGQTFTSNSGETIGAYIGIYRDFTEVDSNNVADYQWKKIEGEDGEPAYTVMLSNENFTISTDTSYVPIHTQNFTCGVTVLKGSNPVGFTITSSADTENDIVTTVSGNTVSIAVAPVEALSATQGVITLTITTTDNHTFTKDVTWSVATQGRDGQPGSSGVSITDVTNYYLATIADSGVTKNTTGWTTTIQNMTERDPYLWNYEVITGSNGTTISSTDPVIIGRYGRDGAAAAEGRGIYSIVEHYQVSASNTTPPTTWSDTPVVTDNTNKYLWNYETITYTDNTSEDTQKRVIGTHGTPGTNGASVTISSTSVQYAISASATVTPSEWGDLTEATAEAPYLWTKTVVTYSDNTSTTSYSVSRQGTDGIPGRNGIDGTSTYVHIKYSLVPNPTDADLTETPSDYIGICHDSNVTDPTTASSYTWVKWQGHDGENGQPGQNGIDGTSSYTHFAYSTSADGSEDFSTTTFSGAKYLGVLVDNTLADSTVYSDYTWTLIKGEDGINGTSITNVINYYLATPLDSGVTKNTQGWTTAIQEIDEDKQYLWNYEEIIGTGNTTISSTAPVIIGRYGRDGAAATEGRGITSITEHYQTSASNVTAPTTWSDSPVATNETNKYLWNYETITYTDATTHDTSPRVIGTHGTPGTSVTVSSTQYQEGTSSITPPSGVWENSPVIVSNGNYLWTKVTYSDGTVAYSIARQGADGNSVTVTNIEYAYKLSTSGTVVPTGSWETTPQAPTTTQYAWTRTTTTFSDGSTAVTYAVGGKTGGQGQKGDNGRGIVSITEYFLLSTTDDSSQITFPEKNNKHGWTTVGEALIWSRERPVLWHCTEVVYENPDGTRDYEYIDKYPDTGWKAADLVQSNLTSFQQGVDNVIDRDNQSIRSAVWENTYTYKPKTDAQGNYIYDEHGKIVPDTDNTKTMSEYMAEQIVNMDGITTRVSATEVAADEIGARVSGHYATSGTSGNSNAKVASLQPTTTDWSDWSLYVGATVTVKFTNANTNATPSLNVNNTGNKAIKSQAGGTLSESEYKWAANSILTFIYDGTDWLLQDNGSLKRLSDAESTISQHADEIESKVSKDGVISSINQSAEQITIDADRVNISGAAIFTSGRLSESSLNNAYDANGAAEQAKVDAIAEIPTNISELNNDVGYQTASDVNSAINTVANAAAQKTDAVYRQQRIYYRKTSSGAPSKNTTWLTTSGTGYGNWSLSIPPLTSGTTKYPYLYTAVQTQTVAQQASGATSNNCSCSNVLIDDTTTIIDGGNIITGTVTAREITADNLQGDHGWINLKDGKFYYGDNTTFANSDNAISWNGSKLQIKADEFLLASGKSIFDEIEAIETWFYATAPTTSNAPASSWTTNNLKEMHLRDIYFDTNSGKSYRWAKDGNTYKWVEIEDKELSALAGRVSTAETNIQSNSGQIALMATKTEVANTYATKDSVPTSVTDLDDADDYATKEYADDAADTAEANAKSDTATKLQSYYTKTETDSAISQTADGITTRVTKLETRSAGNYATCPTAANQAAKVATITPENSNWDLYTGASVTVKFTYANTTASPTLNVNGKGAKAIKSYAGANLSVAEYKWSAGAALTFVYNGTNWLMQDSGVVGRVASAETSITQNSEAIALRATKTEAQGYADTAESNAKSYADTAVSTAKSEIKVTTDGISSEVSKISSAKYIESSTASWTLANIKTWATEGRSQSFNVTSTENLRVGDTVYIKGTDSTRSCPVYIKITVTAINSATKVTGTAHGYEDVIPVDTIKSTINQSSDSVKIQAKHVDIEGAAIFSSGGRLSEASLDAAYDANGAASAAEANAKGYVDGKGYATTSDLPTKVSDLTNDSGFQTASQVSNAVSSGVSGKADKTDAVKQTQRIYYRSNSTTAPTAPSTWVTSTATANSTWTTKRMEYDSTYKYLYTCIQKQTVSGTVTCTTVLLDDTTTVIDGGNIITGTVTANKIAAHSISANKLAITDGTNLAQANELVEDSMPGRRWNGSAYEEDGTDYANVYKLSASNGYLVKRSATQTYMMFTDFVPSSFRTGDELYYEFYAKAASETTVRVNAYGYTAPYTGSTCSNNNGTNLTIKTTEQKFSGTIKLTAAKWDTDAKYYLLGFNNNASTKVQISVRKVIFRKKSAGELIVDGSVTADKIDVTSINASNSLTVGAFDTSDEETQSSILNSSIEPEISSLNVAIGDMQQDLDDRIATSQESLEQTIAEYDQTQQDNIALVQGNVDVLQSQVDDHSDSINELTSYQNTMQGWMHFDVNQGELTIGKTDSVFTTVIDNDSIDFKQDGVAVAYVSANTLHITDAEIMNKLSIGKFLYKPHDNNDGGMSLVWNE